MRTLIPILLGLAALLPACRGSSPVTSYVVHESITDVDTISQFAGLSGVDVIDVRTQRQAGFLQVQLTVQNNRGGDLELEYSDEWMDQNGFTVDAQGGWKGTRLGRGETRTLDLQATAPTAVSVRVNLRERHTVH